MNKLVLIKSHTKLLFVTRLQAILFITVFFMFSVSACSKNDFVENTLALKELIPKLRHFEYHYEGSTVFTGVLKSENVLGNMIYLNYVSEQAEPGVFILAFNIGEEKFFLYHFNLGIEVPFEPIEGKWSSCNKILFKDDSNEKAFSVLKLEDINRMTLGSFESGNTEPFLSYIFY